MSESPSKQPFYTLSQDALASELSAAGFEKFRAKQIFDCVYAKKIFAPQDFPALSAKLKTFLDEKFDFRPSELVGDRRAGDETKKFLFRLRDGNFVECVLLKAPSDDGQIRKFCASAMGGFIRNLTADEIISQALPFVEQKVMPSGKRESRFEFENIVVMGMGEPLANLDNLLAALAVFNSPDKFAFGARRITVSTCGLADKIGLLAESGFPYRLAISLHGATDEVRSQIMPINKKFPLEKLLPAGAGACENRAGAARARQPDSVQQSRIPAVAAQRLLQARGFREHIEGEGRIVHAAARKGFGNRRGLRAARPQAQAKSRRQMSLISARLSLFI